MILTCPDCATSYFVEDERIPPAGRTVKCSSCDVRWRAMPTSSEPQAPKPGVDEAVELDPTAAAEAATVVTPVKIRPPRRPALWRLLAGLGTGIILILALAGLVIFRQPVVNLVPAIAPAYEAVGLKVDALGLRVEDVDFDTTFEAGRPTLLVKGVVHNIRHQAQTVPPITIRLLDEADVLIGGVAARTLNANVPAAGRRYFAITVPEPPAGTATVEIVFDPPAKGEAGHGPGATSGHAASPAAPAAVEAQPLAADSPDALPPHAEH